MRQCSHYYYILRFVSVHLLFGDKGLAGGHLSLVVLKFHSLTMIKRLPDVPKPARRYGESYRREAAVCGTRTIISNTPEVDDEASYENERLRVLSSRPITMWKARDVRYTV